MTANEKHMAEHLEWVRECEEPSNWEQIAYWATVAIAGASTLIVIFGGIGYLARLYR